MEMIKVESSNVVAVGYKKNDLPLNLHVDHINGDHFDNRLKNLRLICPNCHSQTDTYCGKNIKKSD